MIEISVAELSALAQVIFVDLVLAGDNAIVVGMVASGLPAADRRRVIIIGIAAATLMRIGFAVVTVQLMQIVGLILAATGSYIVIFAMFSFAYVAAWLVLKIGIPEIKPIEL